MSLPFPMLFLLVVYVLVVGKRVSVRFTNSRNDNNINERL